MPWNDDHTINSIDGDNPLSVGLFDQDGNPIDSNIDEDGDANLEVSTNQSNGVPLEYSEQTSSASRFTIQKGQLNKLRLRPEVLNEQCESSRDIQAVVNATTIVGQIFKASQDNINGINLAMESAAGIDFDDFESYADSAALQVEWVESTSNPATLDTTNPHSGDNCMAIVGNSTIDTEWERTFSTVDFTNYTGQFWMYSTTEYATIKMRVFVRDSIGNTNSTEIVTILADSYFKYIVDTGALTPDGVTPADISDIVGIGFRLEKRGIGTIYIDDMVSVPNPGSVTLKLWDMGASIPVDASTLINDGTQYTNLGDLGILGNQLAEIEVQLLGGFRVYHIENFIAGVALEMGNNELLNINNYYMLTINYVDTDISVYGPDIDESSRYEPSGYYTNGFSFTAPDEATAINRLGQYSDLMFTIYSTQDVYVLNTGQVSDAEPGINHSANIYIEDANMLRIATIVTGTSQVRVLDFDLRIKPPFIEKGGKIEEEYNDDFTDSVSQVGMGFTYLYISPTANG